MKRAIRWGVLGWLAVAMLAASEHRGVVKFGGLALPGATVTATQGDKKVVAVTDPEGVYAFRELADGNWNIEVSMQCFETARQEVAVAPNAPEAVWDLKLLPAAELAKIEAAPAASASFADGAGRLAYDAGPLPYGRGSDRGSAAPATGGFGTRAFGQEREEKEECGGIGGTGESGGRVSAGERECGGRRGQGGGGGQRAAGDERGGVGGWPAD